MKVTNLNETLSKEELAKLWAETIYMADRPRTWKEWFCWTFYGRFRIFRMERTISSLFTGQNFTFEILQNNGRFDIGLKPSKRYGLEHQPINRYAVDDCELKKLAEFILGYLENKNENL